MQIGAFMGRGLEVGITDPPCVFFLWKLLREVEPEGGHFLPNFLHPRHLLSTFYMPAPELSVNIQTYTMGLVSLRVTTPQGLKARTNGKEGAGQRAAEKTEDIF